MSRVIPTTIDFETFYCTKSKYTLRSMTSEEYIRDPRFQVIGFSVASGSGDPVWVTGTDEHMDSVMARINWDKRVAIGHNMSEFDALILSHRFGIVPRGYQCTLQMARTTHGAKVSNSLANLAKMYGLKSKGDAVVRADGMRREDFTVSQMAEYGEYCDDDVIICRDLYNILRSKFPKDELLTMSWVTRMFADMRLELDPELLTTLYNDIIARKEARLDQVAGFLSVDQPDKEKQRLAVQRALRSDATFAGILRDRFDYEPGMKLSPKRKNMDGTPMEVYAFAKTDDQMLDLAEDDEDEDLNAVVHARLGSKSTITESRVARFVGIASRGPLPVPMVYGKTVTHRLAGGGKINMQNLPGVRPPNDRTPKDALLWTPDGYKRMWKRNEERGLVATQDKAVYKAGAVHVAGLRDAILVPPGKKLVVVDSSNIELRVVHLLAGQMDTVEKLRSGVDMYCDFATELYGYEVTKANYRERQHGKVGMLQLQYQSGAWSFRKAARIMGGIKLAEVEAIATVNMYRSKFTRLPQLWRKCQRHIEDIVSGNEEWIDEHGLCRTDHNGIILPNGMKIQYDNLRQHTFENDERPSWVYDNKETRKMTKLYGGSMTENLGQSLARIVVFDQTRVIESRWGNKPGNGVVLSVHDEIGCIVDEDDAEECLAFMIAAMSEPPKWWKELPVAAEGGIGDTYGECK